MGCRRTSSVGSSAAGTRSTASGAGGGSTTSGCTCGRTASTAPFAASASGCACWWSLSSRERPRRETLPGHRGRGARVHPELARGAAGDEAARLHAPGEARRGRRGTGVLGGSVAGVSNDPNAALLDAQDRERPELPPEVWPSEGQAGTARDLDGPKRRRRPSVPSTSGSSATTTSTPRPPPAWLATATNCSRSTTSPPRTGRTFEPPTSSNRPSQRSGTEAREPRAASPARPCSR